VLIFSQHKIAPPVVIAEVPAIPIPPVPSITQEPNFPQVPIEEIKPQQDRGVFEDIKLKRRFYPWN